MSYTPRSALKSFDENRGPKLGGNDVAHPPHYNQYKDFEVIDVCEQLVGPDGKSGFNLGNAFKYLARAGWKNPDKHIEDLQKAKFYIEREIQRVAIAQNDKPFAPERSGSSEELVEYVCGECDNMWLFPGIGATYKCVSCRRTLDIFIERKPAQ